MILNKIKKTLLIGLLSFGLPLPTGGSQGEGLPTTRIRHFQFHYGASIQNLPAGSHVQVWSPMPQTTSHQKITLLGWNIPGNARFTNETKYDNQIIYFKTTANESREITFQISYQVERHEVRSLTDMDDQLAKTLTSQQQVNFLTANQLVPIGGKPLALIPLVDLPKDAMGRGHVLYNHVGDHMRYDKSKPGYGHGDALWACESRFGNCTDFHCLFISMSRSLDIPAKFVMGFPLPQTRGQGKISGYHCWAYFHVKNRGWIPVDISEADKHPQMRKYYFGNLTPNRIEFSTGRDIILVPRQSGPLLNYFVYPHVEVDGKPWPMELISKQFSYEDIQIK